MQMFSFHLNMHEHWWSRNVKHWQIIQTMNKIILWKTVVFFVVCFFFNFIYIYIYIYIWYIYVCVCVCVRERERGREREELGKSWKNGEERQGGLLALYHRKQETKFSNVNKDGKAKLFQSIKIHLLQVIEQKKDNQEKYLFISYSFFIYETDSFLYSI